VLITSLPDETIDQTVIQFSETPTGCSELEFFNRMATIVFNPLKPSAWLFELAGGAIGDFEDTCVPKSQRETAFTVAALHQWEMGVDDPKCISSAEDVTHPP
jgi:hypothetical protein